MPGEIHSGAPDHLPPFVTGPGETDILMVVVVVFLVSTILIVGNFYFKLHALPERMAHGANSTQLQLVGVLALLALFTHNNIFWVAALLIAALKLPDFMTPLNAMARSLDGISRKLSPGESMKAAESPSPSTEPKQVHGHEREGQADA